MKRAVLVLAVLLVASTPLAAQAQFKYSAKFVCGKATAEVVKAFANAPGVYFTTINVLNPSVETVVKGTKRFSIGLPMQRVGKSTKFIDWVLKPGTAMQVDCSDIYTRFGIAPGEFIEGFVHIVGSPVRFDVAAVYSVTDGDRPVAMDVEHLTPLR